MDFGKLIELAIVVGVGIWGAKKIIDYLKYEKIVSWFQQRRSLTNSNRNMLNVAITQHLNNGNYRIVPGVFNRSTEQFAASEVFEARNVDSRLKEAGSRDGFVVQIEN